MQCPNCGQTNHASWYFCAGCGGSLDTVRVARQQAAAAPVAPQPAIPAAPTPTSGYPAQPAALPPQPHRQPPAPPQPGLFQPALQPAYGQAGPYQINVYVQNHVAPPAPAMPVMAAVPIIPDAPALLVRIVWFLCIGLWLGMLTTVVAWALIVSVLGLPLGVMLLNRLPKIMTLQPTRQHTLVAPYPGGYSISQGGPPQHALLARGVYFLAVGWWVSALWLMAAWGFAGLTLGLGLPVAFWMFNQVGAVTTLARR